ncbi:hypothetical protein MRB53_041160 [Persea americana]|nr:hypothetical protein MRB53_041160 [Persea americana]
MFSATVPKEVVSIVREALKPGFDFVQCVNQDDEPTHERVKQHIVVTKGLENNLAALTELCVNSIEASKESGARPFKAIVYYNSAAEVSLYAQVMQALQEPGTQAPAQNSWARQSSHPLGNLSIGEIHSRLSQGQRTAASDRFRRCQSGILFSSDVTARGLDFPDVTHVIQMSTPSSQEQYVHRIGRTARAGKEGEGWLIINDIELGQARQRVGKLPIKPNNSLETATLDLTTELQVSAKAGRILSMLQGAYRTIDSQTKSNAFKAMLGVFQAVNDKTALVRAMNNLSKYGWGMAQSPAIAPGLAQKLGLSRIPGVNIGNDRPAFGMRDNRGGDDRFGSATSRFSRDEGRRRDPFGSSFDRGSRGGFDRGSRGGYDRGSRGGYDRGSRGGYDGGSRGGYGGQSSF